MTHEQYLLLISVLAGVVTAGFIFFLWEVAERLQHGVHHWRLKRRLQKQEEGLMQQAKEPAAAERPK